MPQKPKVAIAKRKQERPHVVEKPTNAKALYICGSLEGDETIKIGVSDSIQGVKKRLQSEGNVKLIAALWAMVSDEKEIKKRLVYASIRKAKTILHRERGTNGERFNVDFKIRGWLRELRKYPFVVTKVEHLLKVGYVVNSETWLPQLGKNYEKNSGFFNPKHLIHTPNWSELGTDKVTAGDYYTPSWVTKIVREELFANGIGLDPASCRTANVGDSINEGVGALRYFGAAENGLSLSWKCNPPNIWLNPPYSGWDKWVPKIIKEWEDGNFNEMCILTASDTSTNLNFAPMMKIIDALLIPRGRWSFWGEKSGSADSGSHLHYIGPHREKFAKVFKTYGSVMFSSNKKSEK